MILTTLTMMLFYLRRTHVIAVSEADIDDVVDLLEESLDDDFVRDINDEPSLPQWQAHTDAWLGSYFKSRDWQKRPAGFTQDLLTKALKLLSEYAYNQSRKIGPRSH